MHTLIEVPEKARQVVGRLRDGLVEIFRDDLAAVWLYGATVFGHPAVDTDLHILLRRRPSAADGASIRTLHDAILAVIPGTDLDTWYVLLDEARRSEPPANVGPWNPGARDNHWALHRAHWLAGARVVVHGLTPADVVLPPHWAELQESLLAEASDAGRRGLGRPSAYWTLQLCRVLASLETRDVVRSKLDSAQWALLRLPPEVRGTIEAAMRYYARTTREDDPALIARTYAAFYTLVRRMIDAALAP